MRLQGSENENSAHRRQVILEAAQEVFLEYGFFDASLDLVCQRAKVSKGSLYHHYDSKEALAALVYAGAFRGLHHATYVTFRDDAQTGIVKLVGGCIDWFERNRDQGQFLLTAPQWRPGDAAAKPIFAERKRHLDAVEQWLRASHRSRAFRRLPLNAYEPMILGPTLEYLRAWVHRRKVTELRKVRPLLIEAAWDAVRRQPPQARGDGWPG